MVRLKIILNPKENKTGRKYGPADGLNDIVITDQDIKRSSVLIIMSATVQ